MFKFLVLISLSVILVSCQVLVFDGRDSVEDQKKNVQAEAKLI